MHLPFEPRKPERLKGFDPMEFESLPSLLSALSLNEESLVNKISMDTLDQAQDKGKDAHSFD